MIGERATVCSARWRGFRPLLVLMVAVAMPSCDYPFAPKAGERNPRLSSLMLNVNNPTFPDGGVLTILGFPANESFRVYRGQQVPVGITTSSGDQERYELYSELCPARDNWPGVNCFNFAVNVSSDHDPEVLADRVTAIGGRITTRTRSSVFITLFEPYATFKYAREARSWPGVIGVWTYFNFCGPGGCPPESLLVVPVPVDRDQASPNDGILQVQAGDVVTLSYRQPDGGLLERAYHVP
jgi:hypothetical protein